MGMRGIGSIFGLLLLAVGPLHASERYYIFLFGSESFPRTPSKTHTWATLVQTQCIGGSETIVQSLTISWMPATLKIRPLARESETGRNLELHETIRFVLQDGQSIALWGPYEVYPTALPRFQAQIGRLQRGEYRYKSVDRNHGPRVSNCIHAVSDLDPLYGRDEYPLTRFGKLATQYLALEIFHRDRVIQPERNHAWLIPAMGLERYPISRYQIVDGPLSYLVLRRRPFDAPITPTTPAILPLPSLPIPPLRNAEPEIVAPAAPQ
ncbi:Uncharacterized protein OS=Planctomyces brasiliensis (strain ATCC 49424 / DSM 5305 / JCM 21570 / NBRC 103401 / IFAM 1448) GN=Plabr_4392 PE=4 SV=1 [Tuwongella immobilis]|uniref:Uncharacterized protein n=2 Tax=Tuwongella immobilis TaxID=692036 RepID=A0A6C2YLM9_9BACT|nr:Uncharacterized protein OS=Planctomyces brasiliensis (strain ATCC 49424 / DSM 5305 / JCM 21570 / NBRC 103401 / IFAM 1448) GN=Plabr_4392 PE=4 SV=1 [Tuwongella immobilis]VTS00938.1 Uncharacterized protein OS=Planctomyces brasiliensis (strain ATCC 49424 / DSM 5305 / JCM 21570 / NBRC 103401 / IFAM 1448) GN=Plabr_4392 PE=4 SV=1 [Tuwongella immobilis]